MATLSVTALPAFFAVRSRFTLYAIKLTTEISVLFSSPPIASELVVMNSVIPVNWEASSILNEPVTEESEISTSASFSNPERLLLAVTAIGEDSSLVPSNARVSVPSPPFSVVAVVYFS